MFALVLIALVVVVAVAVGARLVTVVSHDRPQSPPRSHSHELDPHSARVR